MEHSKYEAKTHTSYNNSLIESRFKVLLFNFRLGGIPLNMKSVSRQRSILRHRNHVFLYYKYLYLCGHVCSQTSVETRHAEVSRFIRTANDHVVALQCQVSRFKLLIHNVLLQDILIMGV